MARTTNTEEHKRRLRIVTEGRDQGLTTSQIAATVGLKPGTLRDWIRNHCPQHCKPAGGASQSPEEHERRRRIATAGRNEGKSWMQVAEDVGIKYSTLETWLTRHARDLRDIHLEPKPEPEPAPQPAVGTVSSRASLAGWLVKCEPCDRLFVRRERRRADWLAGKHAIMHGFDQHVTCRDGSVWRAAA